MPVSPGSSATSALGWSRMNKRELKSMLRVVFDALPSLVFVVDHDVRIHEYNTAAAELLLAERKTVLKKRVGEVLHCIHSNDVPEGCGRATFCKNCIIRNSVAEAFLGNRVVRRRTRIELSRDANVIEIYALITSSPFSFQDRPLVLLVIEDISEIAELYRMISICSACGKVRYDQTSWVRIETYFNNIWGIDFTHGYCPDCLKAEMDKINSCIKERQDMH